MTVGVPSLYATAGPAVTADQLNSFVQTATTAGVLRTLSGNTGMSVLLMGMNAVNDGLGGFFFWNAASVASDDSLDTIRPTGTAVGAWSRLTMRVVQ